MDLCSCSRRVSRYFRKWRFCVCVQNSKTDASCVGRSHRILTGIAKNELRKKKRKGKNEETIQQTQSVIGVYTGTGWLVIDLNLVDSFVVAKHSNATLLDEIVHTVVRSVRFTARAHFLRLIWMAILTQADLPNAALTPVKLFWIVHAPTFQNLLISFSLSRRIPFFFSIRWNDGTQNRRKYVNLYDFLIIYIMTMSYRWVNKQWQMKKKPWNLGHEAICYFNYYFTTFKRDDETMNDNRSNTHT